MILIFDLDDTLYPEISYVKSGFKEVAILLENILEINRDTIYQELLEILDNFGRGKTFDIFLKKNDIYSKNLVNSCVRIYRSHSPKIKLYPEATKFLSSYAQNLYLVTDGNKFVQKNKIKALNIDKYFKKIFITHQYGTKFAKPSTHCFELIKNLEGCDWSDMIYIADDPSKDFVGLNKKGAQTVRVLTGLHAKVKVPARFSARYSMETLAGLKEIIDRIR